MNETNTHECFSVNFLLLPRISRQLAASENQKFVQNSRHIGRVAHDSNKMARNRLDTRQIKPQRCGHAIFARASICFHYEQNTPRFALCDAYKVRVSALCGAAFLYLFFLYKQLFMAMAKNIRRKTSAETARTFYEELNQRQEHGHWGQNC